MQRPHPARCVPCITTILALLLSMPLQAWANDDCPKPEPLDEARVSIQAAAGTRYFTVELATSAAARAAGLMCRDRLAPDRGMLLVYPQPVMARIWMKNTRMPLDILFVAADGRIIQLAPQTQPGEQHRVAAHEPVTAVLELAAGTVARNGIRIGDRLQQYPPDALGQP